MENEFVTYELSLELKQLGFNEPCVAKYSLGLEKDNYTELQYHLDYSQAHGDRGVFIPIVDNFLPLKLRNSDHAHVPSAPTYQQAFRWIREKYGYDVCIKKIRKDKYQFEIDLKFVMDDYYFIDFYFDSYEKAEIACLKKLIKKIANV
jgi:hypothetical protein